MFAVPGWSVQSSALKTQTAIPGKVTHNVSDEQVADGVEAETISSKKRKRNGQNAKVKDVEVDATNLASLWQTVIEKQEKPKADGAQGKGAKRSKLALDNKNGDAPADVDVPKRKTLKEKNRERKKKLAEAAANGDLPKPEGTVVPAPQKAKAAPPPPKVVAQLTPLQASMRQKLVSARFRHLNQTLYTTPSEHSLELFKQNPEMFQEYHEGFRRQVEVWPENPVDGYAQQIRARGKLRGFAKRDSGKEEEVKTSIMPLPRTEGMCRIADLGCGDAALSAGLDKEKKKLKLEIFSYDLQSPSPLVTRADIANLPLDDDSVDIAIFCLALMGTNWIDFIEEAFRILRWKGELWVAEIKSRFGRVAGKGKKVVDHSVGNRRKPNKKEVKKMEDEADDADLLVEVDGHDVPQETDVSAFVEVLRKRGFVLKDEQSVDLSNKMFVRMCFVKGVTPIKGKCVPVPKGMEKMGLETWKKKPKGKFIEEEEVQVSSESNVLKPCVYKIR